MQAFFACYYVTKNVLFLLLTIQTRGSQVTHQVLREILRDIQANLVPRTMVKEWALNTFAHPSDYWLFRKTVK